LHPFSEHLETVSKYTLILLMSFNHFCGTQPSPL
jgi:hypothetical protein